jgi:hypothetical protein
MIIKQIPSSGDFSMMMMVALKGIEVKEIHFARIKPSS